MEIQITYKQYKNKREYKHNRKATPEDIELLLKTVDEEPSDLGYEFGRWTAERLATYLTEKTGIDLSSSQVRRILKRKKYSYIWAKYDLEDKQDPLIRAKFQEKLAQYLTIAREQPEQMQVWFWDESGFSLRVIRRKNWGKRGKRKNLTGQRRRGRAEPETLRLRSMSWEELEKEIENGYAFSLKKVRGIFSMNSYSN